MIEAADYVVDVGPGAGEYGGEIVASGTVGDIKRSAKSLTGRYLPAKNNFRAENIIPAKARVSVLST